MIGSAEIWEAGRYRFTRPFVAILEPIEGGVLAAVDELGLWADGFDDLDAISDLSDSLAQLADDILESPDATLGPVPQRWKATLAAALSPA